MANLTHTTDQGVLVLRPAGGLDSAGAAAVAPAFRAAAPDGARVVVDLSAVDFLATPGVTMLLTASRRLAETGGRLVAAAATPAVDQVIRRCRLDGVLRLTPTVAEGIVRAKASDVMREA